MTYGRYINIISCISKLQGIKSIMQGDRYRGFLFVDLGKACGRIDPVRWCFEVAAGLLTSQVTTHILLTFMEYLHANAQSKSNISNYMAAIRAFHIIYGLSTHCFRDERLSLFPKFIQNSAPLTPRRNFLIDIQTLYHIIQQCEKMENPIILGPCTSHVFFLPLVVQYFTSHHSFI